MKETILKLHNHFSKLAEGKFTESDFNFKLKGEGGRVEVGELPPERKELIKSDALRNKLELERRFPELLGKEKNILEKIEEDKKAKK